MVIIIFGLILIALGGFQSLGIIKKTKNIIDLVVEKDGVVMAATKSVSQPSGVGGGLKIIRPEMSTSESAPVLKETPPPKPSPAKTTTAAVKELIQNPKPVDKKAEEELVDISLEEGLQMIVDRYNDPKVTNSFSNWDNTLMMTFKDLNKSYLFKINMDQGIELMEGYDEEAAVQVNLDSTTFLKMMTKQINPIKAYSSGGLEVKGKMRNLLKLRKLMF